MARPITRAWRSPISPHSPRQSTLRGRTRRTPTHHLGSRSGCSHSKVGSSWLASTASLYTGSSRIEKRRKNQLQENRQSLADIDTEDNPPSGGAPIHTPPPCPQEPHTACVRQPRKTFSSLLPKEELIGRSETLVRREILISSGQARSGGRGAGKIETRGSRSASRQAYLMQQRLSGRQQGCSNEEVWIK